MSGALWWYIFVLTLAMVIDSALSLRRLGKAPYEPLALSARAVATSVAMNFIAILLGIYFLLGGQ